ncbi:SDR family NAD(P)-dependent oxidoreductase [Streptomyces sp. NPDC087532]|uniref:SDR family NAD(P)-dependent oxidoreductase n=1 Tax=Streptomyces sp. NPDC087532 TaxID=3365795 RepID=UPI003807FA34
MSATTRGRHEGLPRGLWGLDGRRFVVTGGSRGLGAAIVRTLIAEGAHVAACARSVDQLEVLAGEIELTSGGLLMTGPLDVMEPDRLEAFVEKAGRAWRGLDGVVACAGGAQGRSIDNSTPEDWKRTWELNAGHSVRLIRAAVPYLRQTGGGSAVVIASISGWKPSPQAQYGAAKAAQIYLAQSLARELGGESIRVNAVSPGSMLIHGKRWQRMKEEDPARFARFAAEFPSARLVDPHEVAQTVAFLLSDRSSGISGINLPVDRAQNAPTPEGY